MLETTQRQQVEGNLTSINITFIAALSVSKSLSIFPYFQVHISQAWMQPAVSLSIFISSLRSVTSPFTLSLLIFLLFVFPVSSLCPPSPALILSHSPTDVN